MDNKEKALKCHEEWNGKLGDLLTLPNATGGDI